MTKNNFYVITGGPGGGKTALLENLASKGYKYIPETARQIIKERISKGLTPRPDPKTFAREIFTKDCANFISNSDLSSPLFFDRSFMDSAYQLYESDEAGYNKIKEVHLKNRYNNKVFITPPWKEIYQNDAERDQTFEKAIEVYERLDEWYRQHDYDIVVLPKDTIENRTNFILNLVTN
jgi:predicted ATPase